MILEFSISNTFSIREKQTISFEVKQHSDNEHTKKHYVEYGDKKILKLACIYGANASGKTKILSALSFYIKFMLSSFTELEPNDNTNVIPFEFDPNLKNESSGFELVFYIKDLESSQYIRYQYELQITKEKVVYEMLSYLPKGQKKLIFKRDEYNKIKWGSNITGAKKIIEDITRPNSSVISVGAQVKQPLLKYFYDSVFFSFKGIMLPLSNDDLYSYIFHRIETDEYFKRILVNLLSASDIVAVNDIQVKLQNFPDILLKGLPIEFQEHITKNKEKLRTVQLNHNINGNDYLLPFGKESEGTKRFMQLTLPLYDLIISKSVVLIDELESSLHSALVELFLQLFIELSDESQLLFTTHNQDLLDSNLLRDDEVWFSNKTLEANSVYSNLTDYTGVRKNASRKRLYNNGKFNALPKIQIDLLKDLFNIEKNRKHTES